MMTSPGNTPPRSPRTRPNSARAANQTPAIASASRVARLAHGLGEARSIRPRSDPRQLAETIARPARAGTSAADARPGDHHSHDQAGPGHLEPAKTPSVRSSFVQPSRSDRCRRQERERAPGQPQADRRERQAPGRSLGDRQGQGGRPGLGRRHRQRPGRPGRRPSPRPAGSSTTTRSPPSGQARSSPVPGPPAAAIPPPGTPATPRRRPPSPNPFARSRSSAATVPSPAIRSSPRRRRSIHQRQRPIPGQRDQHPALGPSVSRARLEQDDPDQDARDRRRPPDHVLGRPDLLEEGPDSPKATGSARARGPSSRTPGRTGPSTRPRPLPVSPRSAPVPGSPPRTARRRRPGRAPPAGSTAKADRPRPLRHVGPEFEGRAQSPWSSPQASIGSFRGGICQNDRRGQGSPRSGLIARPCRPSAHSGRG